ncbi:MAG: hypothetical protein H6701_16760 [Myxococcales bacterium]|nr:hypothetical protein [Myxococcales bacterium]
MRDEHETASAAREAQAAEVLIEALPDDALAAPLLVVDDVDGQLRGALPRAVRWSRVANGALSGEAAAWAPAGPHPGATLRMPKAKAALDLALHAVASTLPVGAPLWLYGANDEGIRSVAGRLDGLFEGVEAVSAKRRCRVWLARRGAGAARAPRSAGRAVSRLAWPGGAVEWVEYPGVFAAGRLDEATAVLLGTMAPVAAGRAGARLRLRGGRCRGWRCGGGRWSGWSIRGCSRRGGSMRRRRCCSGRWRRWRRARGCWTMAAGRG